MSSVGVDFDGVIHAYTRGWQGGVIYDEPVPGAFDAIRGLQAAGYGVFVFTSREAVGDVANWIYERSGITTVMMLDDSALPPFWDDTTQLLVTNRKLGAVAYIDDRAIRFTDWGQAMNELQRVEIERMSR